jgi:hypothetical protein
MAAPPQRERVNVAVAALTCGRLSEAARVRAVRGPYRATADHYGVRVTEPGSEPRHPRAFAPGFEGEPVLELWGGEMLAFESSLRAPSRRTDPRERARVAARTVRDHDLDALEVVYPDGSELSADRVQVVLHGPRRGLFRRRGRVLAAALGELL